MQTIRKFGRFTWDSSYWDPKRNVPLYFEGEFRVCDAQGISAHHIIMPRIFEAYGTSVHSGNWRMGGNIKDFCEIRWQIEHKPDAWARNEWSEFWVLITCIDVFDEAYKLARFGVLTDVLVGDGIDNPLPMYRDTDLAQAIAGKLDIIIVRANELLGLLPTV